MADCRGPVCEARLPPLPSSGPVLATTCLQSLSRRNSKPGTPLRLMPCQGASQPCPPPVLSPACVRPANPARCRPPHTPQASCPAQGRTHCNYCPARLCAGVLRTVRRRVRRRDTVLLWSCRSFAAAAEAYCESQRDIESRRAGCYEFLAVVVRRPLALCHVRGVTPDGPRRTAALRPMAGTVADARKTRLWPSRGSAAMTAVPGLVRRDSRPAQLGSNHGAACIWCGCASGP